MKRPIACSQEAKLESVQRILSGLSQQKFYGSIELRFESGHVVLVRKTETTKPDDCWDNRGDNDGRSR